MQCDPTLKVFISSTFRDMFAEREELVKRVFPQVRNVCESRGVPCSEIDLRWGILDEQPSLPLCLEQARSCSAIIGLLGERYGSLASRVRAEDVERVPWLARCDATNRSITELELAYGVLENPEFSGQAWFYFRDPAYIDTLSADERQFYRECATRSDVQKHGPDVAARRAEERRTKLASLKSRIRESGLALRENYRDPETVAQWILDDLLAWIDVRYPVETLPTPLDREAAAHQAFARIRCRHFHGRENELLKISRHTALRAGPLVISGPPGAGKSALLARWATQHWPAGTAAPLVASSAHGWWRRLVSGLSRPADAAFLLCHFAAASPAASDWGSALRRLIEEIKRAFEINGALASDDASLAIALPNWLEMAGKRGRLILLIDGLDELHGPEHVHELAWLPDQLPPQVSLLVSTGSIEMLERLRGRHWPELKLGELPAREREQLTIKYFEQFGKEVPPAVIEPLSSAESTGNHLFFSVVAEELRVLGDRQIVIDRAQLYLAATSLRELYRQVLARLEGDYERRYPGMVRASLRLLAASRGGLYDAELLDMLGQQFGSPQGTPFPRAEWVPLALALQTSLSNRLGLIGFAHAEILAAIEGLCFPNSQTQTDAKRVVCDYFEARPWSPRKVEEYPWQLDNLGQWERLAATLSDPHCLSIGWRERRFELQSYWSRVEEQSSLRMATCFRPLMDSLGANSEAAWPLANLLQERGHWPEARAFGDRILEGLRKSGDDARLQSWLNLMAVAAQHLGKHDRALALLTEHEQLCVRRQDHASLVSNRIDQGVLHWDRGNADRALALYDDSERMCRERGLWGLLPTVLGNQALVYAKQRKFSKALRRAREQEKICRQLGDMAALSRSLGYQGKLRFEMNDIRGAMKLHRQEEEICRRLNHRLALAQCLGNQAMLHTSAANYDAAIPLLREKERCAREVCAWPVVADALAQIGWILGAKMKQTDLALRRLNEAALIAQDHGTRELREQIARMLSDVRHHCR